MIRLLKILIPHFITRIIMLDDNKKMVAICRGRIIDGYVSISKEDAMLAIAKNCPVITQTLGISWLGSVIFFWNKNVFYRQD